MSLTAEIYMRNDHGDLDENPTDLDGRHLVRYEDIITAALRENSPPEEKDDGVMHWYDGDLPIDIKVHSASIGVEEREGCLWGVAECRVAGSLSSLELANLKQYLTTEARIIHSAGINKISPLFLSDRTAHVLMSGPAIRRA